MLSLQHPRVTFVHSYYLTSFVYLSFYCLPSAIQLQLPKHIYSFFSLRRFLYFVCLQKVNFLFDFYLGTLIYLKTSHRRGFFPGLLPVLFFTLLFVCLWSKVFFILLSHRTVPPLFVLLVQHSFMPFSIDKSLKKRSLFLAKRQIFLPILKFLFTNRFVCDIINLLGA